MAPIKFTAAAAAAAEGSDPVAVTVTNRYAFLGTDHLDCSWRLMVGGQPVPAAQLLSILAAEQGGKPAAAAAAAGWVEWQLPGNIPPGGAETVLLPCSRQQLLAAAKARLAAAAAGDVLLECRAVLKNTSSWAEAGHIMTHMQLPISVIDSPQQQQQQCGPPLTVTTSPEGDIILKGNDGLVVSVSKLTGCIAAVQKGQQLLLQGMLPCFMRATTDNDRGGSGGSSYAARWAAAGLDRLEVSGKVSGLSHFHPLP
jgi:beta-galactosidase